mmetsp:Transcript_3385/g.7759  ORF Transcript_3385/g.7759 Transcript_3385/m.7759 type:complete len:150 (-) Transcript_3385:62-511(-)
MYLSSNMHHPFSSPRRILEPESLQNNGACCKISVSPTLFDRPGEKTKLAFSIFASKEGDLFEPIAIDPNRTQWQQAALNSALKQSIEFVFGYSSLETTSMTLNQSDTPPGYAAGQANDPHANSRKRNRDEDSSTDSGSKKPKFRPYCGI